MLEFDEARHEYRLDGQVLPSVTQIIRFLNYDTAENAKSWLRDVAADRGSRVHKYCMLYDFGELPDEIDFDCIGYVKAYVDFCRDYTPQWTMIEKPLANADLGYAGTLDRYGIINGKPAILDIKTGTSLNHLSVAVQLLAYEHLIAVYGEVQHMSLQLTKTGTYKVKTYTDDVHGILRSCLQIHNALQKGKKNG